MENTFCLIFDFWLNSAVDYGCFHARNVLQTLHSVKFLFPNVPSDLSLLAFGIPPAREADSAGGMPKVPKGQGLGRLASPSSFCGGLLAGLKNKIRNLGPLCKCPNCVL